MIHLPKLLVLIVAGLLGTPAPSVLMAADNESTTTRPRKTVRDLILEIGEPLKEHKQLKLKIEGEIRGKGFTTIPRKMLIDLRYDKGANQIFLKTDSTFDDGGTRSVGVFADETGGVRWHERSARVEGSDPTFHAEKLIRAKALPNPWRLALGLEFPGVFADSLHGYEALSREFARSRRLNREVDEADLVWFDLRPAPGVAAVLQREFNAGMTVKAGFLVDGGWLERLEIGYAKSDTLIDLRVVERATSLSEEDKAVFVIPDRVAEKLSKAPKSEEDPAENETPRFGPWKELAPKPQPVEGTKSE